MPTWRPPGVRALTTYKRGWLRQDIVAGLVLSTLLVPQGMAYAELAGLPPITGLYTSVLCLIGYALFGPSRILVLGPDSSLGPMIAATLLPILASNGDPERAVALASLLALLVGVITTVAGVARLGFIADLISKPTQIGYMNGLALTILIGQLPKLCGFSVDADGVIDETRGFLDGLVSGEVVGAALAVGLTAFALIVFLNRWLPRIPGVLMAVVVTIVATALLDLGEHGVSLVGTLPQGFPPLTLPGPADDLPLLLAGAAGIALVSLTDTISTSSAFAARTGQEVDGNGEMIGIGAANIAASFFQGFPVSTSGSRTAVAERSGAKTQLTGLVGAGAIVLMLVLVPGLLADLPQPTLAAVVIAASLSLADIPGTVRLWRQRRIEFLLTVLAFLGVALLGVLEGIAVAVVLSILNVFRRAWWPYQTILGRVPGVAGLHDRTQYPDAEVLPGAVIFRFDAPLIFANARTFRDQMRRLAAGDPRPRWIIIAAEPITDVDTTAADMLVDLDEELNAAGTSLVFAELKSPVRAKLECYEMIGPLDPDHFFPTLTGGGQRLPRADRHRLGQAWSNGAMKLELGSAVACSDGPFGELADVVVDPARAPRDASRRAAARTPRARAPDAGGAGERRRLRSRARLHDRRGRGDGAVVRVGLPARRRASGRRSRLGRRHRGSARVPALPGGGRHGHGGRARPARGRQLRPDPEARSRDPPLERGPVERRAPPRPRRRLSDRRGRDGRHRARTRPPVGPARDRDPGRRRRGGGERPRHLEPHQGRRRST